MENTGYKNLKVYSKSHQLVLLVYKITKKFPAEELFGLVSQMRRCAISVVANIVEGYARRTPKDKLQFYYISRASLTELEYYIDLSHDLDYTSEEEYADLQLLRIEVGKLLNGFIRFTK